MSDSFFEILGVPRRWHLGADELERNYHERSRQHHPDRHAKADAQTRVKNALATSQLTEAYRTLRDATKRAEYLLTLEGIRISDEREGHKVAPAFLMEIMELREQLMDARAEGDAPTVETLAATVRARMAEIAATLDAGFGRYEAGDRAALTELADALVAERYFRRFLEEADAFLEAHAEASH